MKDEWKGCWCFTQVTEEGLTLSKKDLPSPTFLEKHKYIRSPFKTEES